MKERYLSDGVLGYFRLNEPAKEENGRALRYNATDYGKSVIIACFPATLNFILKVKLLLFFVNIAYKSNVGTYIASYNFALK